MLGLLAGIVSPRRLDPGGSGPVVWDSAQAAIASSLAGEVYGLNALRSRCEDQLGNTTRFVVMSRRREEPDPNDGPCMTSFIFQVRSVPGALYKSLGGGTEVEVIPMSEPTVQANSILARGGPWRRSKTEAGTDETPPAPESETHTGGSQSAENRE